MTPTPTTTPTPATLGTVVLIPGYGGSVEGLATIAAALRKAGRHVTVVALPAQASQTFERQALTLEAVVRAEEKAGRGPVDIVAHSNGGVLARYWARHYKGAGRARVILTLGAPQHGTQLADLAFSAAPQLCTPACGEVRPSSAFLKALNASPDTAGIAWISAYTDNDDVVTPPTSALLPGAVNVRLQAVCSGAVIDHSGLLGDPLALGLILDELQAPRVHAVGPADCTRLRTLGA
jgi:triacylglycerol esterase/lipase EstA (alpha/beta hydrolase family)